METEEEIEAVPIWEFKYNSPECSTPPDSMILWPDMADSESAALANFYPESCGFQYLAAEKCCRSSLDLSLTRGYQSVGFSQDLEKFPSLAKNQPYCLLNNGTERFGLEKAYFAANGACHDSFSCFENKSLMLYPESQCAGVPEVFSLGDDPLDLGFGSVVASFVVISQSSATIEYSWTTYFPYSLFFPSLGNAADIASIICCIFSIVLPTFFFFW
jgi:hypothetical protein